MCIHSVASIVTWHCSDVRSFLTGKKVGPCPGSCLKKKMYLCVLVFIMDIRGCRKLYKVGGGGGGG